MDDRANDVPEIVGVHIRRYKNLTDLWLPWHDGLALFGVNGAGKTNLLECLALLIGTPESLRLARPRLSIPHPDDLSIIARMGPPALPWAPELVQPLVQMARGHEAVFGSLQGLMNRVLSDAKWWHHIGADGGTTFNEGLRSAGLPETVADLLSGLTSSPVIRFTLTEFDWSAQESHGATRRYARTLVLPSISSDLEQHADTLPAVFAPLRTLLAHPTDGDSDPWCDILELPPTPESPAELQWLPRLRTGEEVNDDLEAAFEEASEPIRGLAETLSELPLASAPKDGDWHWWLHRLGEQSGREELNLTLPNIEITSEGGGSPTYDISVASGTGPAIRLGRTGEESVLEALSSGERRWVDEALATIARALRRTGLRASMQSDVFFDVPKDQIMEAVLSVAESVDANIAADEYWSEETFDLTMQALESPILAAAYQRLGSDDGNDVMRDHNRGVLGLQHRLGVRVFDEPEAHLHVSAQGRAALALEGLRARGENVIIASHSSRFLALPGWSLVHVELGDAGTQLRLLSEHDSQARSALARQLGINRGDLLAGINLVLIVEGEHDRLVLDILFGDPLREAGVAVVRMHGTNHLLATAELDFIDRYVDSPVVVLVDYARTERVDAGRPVSDEEKSLLELRKSCKRRGRSYTQVGLKRPDITAYLSERVVRESNPDFPGWGVVLRAFEARRSRPPFKTFLFEKFATDLRDTYRIRQLLERMEELGQPPVGELTAKVMETLASTTRSCIPATRAWHLSPAVEPDKRHHRPSE